MRSEVKNGRKRSERSVYLRESRVDGIPIPFLRPKAQYDFRFHLRVFKISFSSFNPDKNERKKALPIDPGTSGMRHPCRSVEGKHDKSEDIWNMVVRGYCFWIFNFQTSKVNVLKNSLENVIWLKTYAIPRKSNEFQTINIQFNCTDQMKTFFLNQQRKKEKRKEEEVENLKCTRTVLQIELLRIWLRG